jgi:hypothetical protein
VAEAMPSLLAGNIASFSLDLTPSGASFMEQALLAADGAAADEAPIQVTYDLRFWARLPPARIHLEVNAERMHKYIEEQFRGRSVAACTGYDYDNADVNTESLTLSGAVTCQIDTGSGSLPEAVTSELRAYAFDLLKQLVQHSFFSADGEAGAPAAAHPAPPARGSALPSLHSRLRGGQRIVRKDIDEQTMSITLDLEQSSVVPWAIRPTGTLQTLLGGDQAVRAKHVRKLRLNDPFFATLETTVQVFAEFAAIDHVEVELAYAATDEQGRPHAVGTVLVFTSAAAQEWSTAVVGGVRDYRSRARAVLAGGRAQPFGEWTTTHAPRIVMSIPSPGRLAVEVATGSIDYDKLVRGVQVRLAYEDAAAGVPREEGTVLLSREQPTARYERRIDAPQSSPLLARTRFELKDGDVVDSGEWVPVLGSQLIVNQPSESLLEVRLLPSGKGWGDVVAVMVDLAYEDAAHDLSFTDTFMLKKLDEFATWQVYLRDRARRTFRYRWTASFSNGDLVKRDWIDNPGDPVIAIALERPGIDVTIVADSLDFTACPLTQITITHDVPGGASETFIFRDRTAQRWHVDAADGAPVAFVCSVTHFPADRDPVVLADRRESDPMIVLPAYRATSAGELRVEVMAQLVDFAVTPLVAIDLSYQDPVNDVDASHSLTLSRDERAAKWLLPTRDARVTGFRRRVTYYLADGTQVAGEWSTETVPRVIVPAYQPQPRI